MNGSLAWLATAATIAVLGGYQAFLAAAQRRHPDRLARSAHAGLREAWFAAVSEQGGTEILAVQTLRNSLMSATMTASTAALGLVATVTLSAPSLHAVFVDALLPALTPRLLLALLLLALLSASLVCSAMAVRYYNHLGFICGMPVQSAARRRWAGAGVAYARRAGILYGWGLRHLILVAPLIAALLHPLAGPPAAALAVTVMSGFDRVGAK